MKDVVGLIALVMAAAGIGAMLLPALTDMLRRHDPYNAVKPYSMWVRRTGLAMAVVGVAVVLLSWAG